MKYRFLGQLLAATLFLVTSLAQAAPELLFSATPEWVEILQPVESKRPPQGSVRVHLSNSQIRHRGKQQQYYFQVVVEPLNQQGVSEIAELNFSFYPAFQKLLVHDISVQRNGERLDRLQKDGFKLFQSEQELSNKLYSEQWNALYILEDIRPGDIISYAYTIEGSNPIFARSDFGRLYLSWPQAVDRRFVKISSDKKLNYRFNHREYPVHKTQQQADYAYTLDLRDVAGVPMESEYPYWHDPLNYIQYSSYDNWGQVNNWALELYQVDRSLPEALKKKLDNWRAQLGLEAAVSKAIEYVQEDIRYFGIELGINSHQPRTPRETLEKRYGDCKDKALLLTSMLAHLGVQSYPALVSSSRGRDIGEDIPSPETFNHVINLIELNDQEYWVDATASGQGIDIKNKGFFDYELALPIARQTRALKAVEPSSEQVASYNARIEEQYDIDAAENRAELRVRSHFSHLKAEQVRQFFLSADSEQIKSSYTNFIASYYPGVSGDPEVTYKDSLQENQLDVSEHYQISDFAQLSSARKIFSLYGSALVPYLSKPQRPIRQSPLVLTHPVDVQQSATVNIHGELLWQEELGTTTIDNPWFTFTRKATLENRALLVNYAFKSKTDHVEPQDVPEYLAQFNQLDKALQYKFWAKGKAAPERNRSQEMKNLIKSLIRK
ncbi:DUF3857 domain-containing transglutaminase family protein [Microbulbifer variabilis]|uniref:DUF3857 domain-containing transglutaminase family protein n=1 Tax=Microbulbifer variabilis TaxID=266805 RepID=UPI001CFC5B08|nr:DUF3857 domain-containing protein [Microbulbifer variabilis]